MRRQTDLVNQLVGDGERALKSGDEQAASLALYKARLGGPKNKRLQKVLQEQGNKALVQKVELGFRISTPGGKADVGEARKDGDNFVFSFGRSWFNVVATPCHENY